MNVKIYHNPRCSKSRETLHLLRDHEIEPEVIEYLKTPMNKATLEQLLQLLALPVKELVRTGDSAYKDHKARYDGLSDEGLKDLLLDTPALMQRPIVVVDEKKAVIGRPPENVLELIGVPA